MSTQDIDVDVGVPGPSGAGVSAAEKATFVTLSGTNIFTAVNRIRANSATAFIVESASGTTDRTLVVDATNKEVELWNDAKLRGFADDGTTETFVLDAAAGTLQLDSNLTLGGRIIGEQVVWPLPMNGGGSAISTGVFDAFGIPYDALITRWDMVDIDGGTTNGIVVDIWCDEFANFPPTNADSITTSEEPTISNGSATAQDTSLNSGNGWAVTRGDICFRNVDSNSGSKEHVLMLLWVTKA